MVEQDPADETVADDPGDDEREDLPLSSLGVALEEGRIASGMTTAAFLRAHLLDKRTWNRLLRGLPGANGQPLPDSTVLRYGRAAGLLDSTALALARDSAEPQEPPGASPADASKPRLSRLGEALERGRVASGLSTEAFLRSHGLNKGTWRRLLYRVPTPRRWRPRDSTVLRYARAAGVPKPTALALAIETFGPDQEDLSAFGAALEGARRKTGERTMEFLHKRGLSYATWYRLLHRDSYRQFKGPWPPRELVDKYALSVGLDRDLAWRLVQQDRRSAVESEDGSAAEPPTP